MRFALPGAAWEIVVADDTLRTFNSRVQKGNVSSESVGQLYSPSLSSSKVVVQTATVLQPKFAQRTRVVIDRPAAEAERRQMFKQGMHCAGVWHTHPELFPHPSSDDFRLAEDYAGAASSAGLVGVVFVIVGVASFPEGLFVGVHDGNEMHRAIALARPPQT